jgi:hypothetical protein
MSLHPASEWGLETLPHAGSRVHVDVGAGLPARRRSNTGTARSAGRGAFALFDNEVSSTSVGPAPLGIPGERTLAAERKAAGRWARGRFDQRETRKVDRIVSERSG